MNRNQVLLVFIDCFQACQNEGRTYELQLRALQLQFPDNKQHTIISTRLNSEPVGSISSSRKQQS
jgi:hypothetical protein